MFSFGLVSSCPFWACVPLFPAGLCKFPRGLSCSFSIDPFIWCQHKILLILLWATLGRGEAQILRSCGPWLFSSVIFFSMNKWISRLSESLPHHVLRKYLWASTQILNFGKSTCIITLCWGCKYFEKLKHPASQTVTGWIHPADRVFKTPNWLVWTRNSWANWSNFDLLLQSWLI